MTNENNECVTCSNQLWAIDRTKLSIPIRVASNQVCKPLLDLIVDLYSGCVAGYKLNVASHSPVLTALRHAILPKDAQAQYNTHREWGIYGTPKGIIVGGAISSDSSALDRIAHQLGCQLHKFVRPSEGGLVERFCTTVDRSLLSQLPGYHETLQVPSTVNHETYLDLQQLEQVVGRYIVDNYKIITIKSLILKHFLKLDHSVGKVACLSTQHSLRTNLRFFVDFPFSTVCSKVWAIDLPPSCVSH